MQKLVRNKIPEIISMKGGKANVRYADNNEYWGLLLNKLYEEIVEFTQSPCVEELADIYEVVLSIAKYIDVNEFEIQNYREKKKEMLGDFSDKCVLIKGCSNNE